LKNLPKQLRRWGWISFSIMWLPFTTLMVAMMGMPSGEYAWAELPLLARASLLIGGFFTLTSTILLVGAPIAGAVINQRIISSGRLATAKILSIADTGTTINRDPLVLFLLEVQAVDRPAFQAETEKLVSRLEIPQIQPGSLVEVKYDPESLAVAILGDQQTS
jgi:hypothetical protein